MYNGNLEKKFRNNLIIRLTPLFVVCFSVSDGRKYSSGVVNKVEFRPFP